MGLWGYQREVIRPKEHETGERGSARSEGAGRCRSWESVTCVGVKCGRVQGWAAPLISKCCGRAAARRRTSHTNADDKAIRR